MKNKVLVVDDNPKNLQVVAALLAENDYLFEVALNGKSALKWLEKTKFDAILLDVMMPEMDGFATCKTIKADPENCNIPIIFLTASHDIENITQGFANGGVDYITKPFNQSELLVRLNTHIELKKSREKILDLNGWLQSEIQKKTEEITEANNNLKVAYNELKKLDDAKTDFLNTISHELRTPLNGIVGSINLLNSFDHEPHIKEILSLLNTSVSKLEKYSYTALQISNLQLKGESQLALQPIDILPIIKATIHTLKLQYTEKCLEASASCACTEAIVNIDQQLFRNALTALLECSIIYTNNGNIKVETNCQYGVIHISITDDGSLYSDKDFKHFFQSVKNQNYQFERNNAIELYLAKIVFLLHKGNIEFNNKEDGKGTITVISLPLAKANIK
ncbi:hybrid sensor histidine kinase/response regulator [Plebeiibacterium marinum]|uniref:histidine kinase n=1 Tax=Plebeiibacterium marinum TaxID=2992111 RepID=A0AAE3SJA0_9BACT|nr:hybrid sensor histidine kinase/response regulator [Plebeiobacterium marinum]MCW3805224.1 hybrid sensor histidine kinase/response regulator [Plebeiobacterium marinum]